MAAATLVATAAVIPVATLAAIPVVTAAAITTRPAWRYRLPRSRE
jgi:hypothetical protein